MYAVHCIVQYSAPEICKLLTLSVQGSGCISFLIFTNYIYAYRLLSAANNKSFPKTACNIFSL